MKNLIWHGCPRRDGGSGTKWWSFAIVELMVGLDNRSGEPSLELWLFLDGQLVRRFSLPMRY